MYSSHMFKNLKADIPASVVVFFVALPLCLGIALASGAPLFAGIIAGFVGGIVVGAASGSHVGVSGPAAGLAAIVLTAITTLGGYENFLLAVVIGGIIQIVLGVLKAGVIGYYFPSSVIKGMLCGIGIIIILKQIPHFFGYNSNPEGDFAFFQINGENTFSELLNVLNGLSIGPTIIGVIGLGILLLWNRISSAKYKIFQILQGPVVAVIVGIIFYILTANNEWLSISKEYVVNVPIPENLNSFIGQFSTPNFGGITNSKVWITGFTIAIVASLETLLCTEATDKLDPLKRVTPTNRELVAQGIGNTLSGLIGGLPVTQVIVRSSANIQSGGRTKLSAILHGFLLLIAVISIPGVLNKIPLSVLAAILLIVGYKLANPGIFIKIYKTGWKQFIPFIVTVLGIVFTDLLIGISLGLATGVIIVLFKSLQNSHFLNIENNEEGKKTIKMTFAQEVTFFNKGAILKELDQIPRESYLTLDVRRTRFLDHDIIEILDEFMGKAKSREITIKIVSERGIVENPTNIVRFFKLRPKPERKTFRKQKTT